MPAGSSPLVGLVQDQQLGPVHNRLRHAQALFHAQRILLTLSPMRFSSPTHADHLVDALLCDALSHPGVLLQVFPAGHVGVHLGILHNRADVFHRSLKVGPHIVPVDGDLTRIGLQKTGDHLDGRGLSTRRSVPKAEYFPLLCGEGKIVYHFLLPKDLVRFLISSTLSIDKTTLLH